jgi:hypothetical protein
MEASNKLTLSILKRNNLLDGIVCYEPVDIEVVEKLIQTDLLIHNFKNPITRDIVGSEEKQLKRYRNLIDRETGLAKVEYKRCSGMSYGRSNPKGALGMFSMRKVMRHTLAKRKGLVDIDIVNAHPQFLLQVCKANGLCCEKLEYYVKNRNAVIKRITDITGESRDRVKELFIALLFYGKFDYWLKEKTTKDKKTGETIIVYKQIDIYAFQNDMDLVNYIEELTTELDIIGKNIEKANPKLAKEVDKNKELKKQKNFNRLGSIVSFYLQEWEIRILECIYKYCKDKGYINDNKCVLCADGIMLEETLIKDKDIFAELIYTIKNEVGFQLEFDTKELDECLTDEFIASHIITENNLDKEKFDTFNRDYFISLNGYLRKKIYFEIFVAKILRPDPAYVYIEKEAGIEVMSFYTQNKITETFNHLKTGELYDNGEEEKFMTKWINDEKIRCFNKMDFIPYNDNENITSPIPTHIFNLFRGYSTNCKADYNQTKQEKILQPFMELGLELCGGEERNLTYLLKYLAHMVQYPNIKNPIAFIIKGKQGTGKNVFLNAVGGVIGKTHYITSSNPKDFFGDHAEGFYHKLLVNMNECEGKDTFEFEGRLKSFITEDTITLNRKFVQPITIANLARLIIFTNKPNPIPIDIRSKDRRYVVYETTDKFLDKKYGTKFWKMLVEHFNKPEFSAALYDYLNELDISNTDWRVERPITKAYMDMCKLYVPVEVLFLENKIIKSFETDKLLAISNKNIETTMEEGSIVSRLETQGITGEELYKDYTTFAKEFGFFKDSTYQKNSKSFYCKINELELPIVSKKPHNITTFYFNVEEVLKVMKERKWVDRSDQDIVEEPIVDIEGEDFTDYFTI